MAKTSATPTKLQWLNAGERGLAVHGLAWFKQNGGRFCRLPLSAEGKVRQPVWELAQQPASAFVGFRSDTTALSVRVKNCDPGLMPHMPGSGSNGLSLYCGGLGRWRPWAVAVPDLASAGFERELFKDVPRVMREFRLYLPLYKMLLSLELGLSRGARLAPAAAPALPKPVVFYGTSITQGGCANTPGSDYVSAVGRQLNLKVVNLGFSGNGFGEPELAGYMAQIDAALYVLDYAANNPAPAFRRSLPRFVSILRKRRPKTPILLMTNVCFDIEDHQPGTRKMLEDRRDITFEFYTRRRRCGDTNLHVVDGFSLLPPGIDGAYVDGVHPTTHGFQIMAERLTPLLRRVLMT